MRYRASRAASQLNAKPHAQLHARAHTQLHAQLHAQLQAQRYAQLHAQLHGAIIDDGRFGVLKQCKDWQRWYLMMLKSTGCSAGPLATACSPRGSSCSSDRCMSARSARASGALCRRSRRWCAPVCVRCVVFAGLCRCLRTERRHGEFLRHRQAPAPPRGEGATLTDRRYLLAEKGCISTQESSSPCWRNAAACDLTACYFSGFLRCDSLYP